MFILLVLNLPIGKMVLEEYFIIIFFKLLKR